MPEEFWGRKISSSLTNDEDCSTPIETTILGTVSVYSISSSSVHGKMMTSSETRDSTTYDDAAHGYDSPLSLVDFPLDNDDFAPKFRTSSMRLRNHRTSALASEYISTFFTDAVRKSSDDAVFLESLQALSFPQCCGNRTQDRRGAIALYGSPRISEVSPRRLTADL